MHKKIRIFIIFALLFEKGELKMKKSKLSITLVTSFIAAMALTACNEVTASKTALVTFTPYGSKETIDVVTDDLYNAYRGTSAGVNKFYEKILEVLIRYEFKDKGFDKGEMKYSEIETWAKNQVQEQKDNAKANAKSNGTNYDDEWDAILESNNVDDAKELQEKFIYEKEKEVITNWYADDTNNAEALKNEFLGVDKDNNPVDQSTVEVKAAMPYHIRHILVKVDEASESNNVDDAKELQEKFIYEKEKEVITNWYADDTNNAEALKNEFLGVDKDNNPVDQSTVEVKAAMPYHIRHILVKVDEASEANAKFYKGTISESQAKLLADTVSTLASGKFTFSQVASMYSEDGSASSGGDVGIMTNTATSGSLGMVNEFQLGLYAYDNLYDAANIANAGAANIKKGLGITDEVAAALPAAAVEVPYEAFVKIGEAAKVTADKEGNKLANGSSTVYPRNVLWNKYLNLHNVFVIANKKVGADSYGAADPTAEFNTLAGADAYDASLPRFKDGVLVDEHDNVIIGVRSEYGIHLMVIEKSMYDEKLADYYTTKLPSDKDYPTGETYVGYIQSQNIEDYKKRADDVKSKITSFDATYDYRLYQYLIGEAGTITFTGAAEGLGDQIDRYIAATKENNVFKQEDGLKKVWRTYTELLDIQAYNRNAKFNTVNAQGDIQNNLTRLVSEKIADDFMKLYNGLGDATTYAKFAEGGEYYYYA